MSTWDEWERDDKNVWLPGSVSRIENTIIVCSVAIISTIGRLSHCVIKLAF